VELKKKENFYRKNEKNRNIRKKRQKQSGTEACVVWGLFVVLGEPQRLSPHLLCIQYLSIKYKGESLIHLEFTER
jgi:hypothetical protein